MNNKEVAASWSGGKDSCLACYQALKEGYTVRHLLNFISREYKRCCFHGIDAALLKTQAGLIGIPLIQHEVTADMKAYEQEFKEAVLNLRGISGMVFGDIYLDEHKDWVERVCKDVGITAVEPLWNGSPLKLVEEFIRAGFKAVIVSAQADKFDKDFVGRTIDEQLVSELVSREICPCGENGEFHTLVIDGPLFERGAIEITESEPVFKKGFWEYWFLDVKKYRIRQKRNAGAGSIFPRTAVR